MLEAGAEVFALSWQWVLEGDRFLMNIFISRPRSGGTAPQPVERSAAGGSGEVGREERRVGGRSRRRGGVKGSAGEGWTLRARRVHMAPTEGW